MCAGAPSEKRKKEGQNRGGRNRERRKASTKERGSLLSVSLYSVSTRKSQLNALEQRKCVCGSADESDRATVEERERERERAGAIPIASVSGDCVWPKSDAMLRVLA